MLLLEVDIQKIINYSHNQVAQGNEEQGGQLYSRQIRIAEPLVIIAGLKDGDVTNRAA